MIFGSHGPTQPKSSVAAMLRRGDPTNHLGYTLALVGRSVRKAATRRSHAGRADQLRGAHATEAVKSGGAHQSGLMGISRVSD